MKTTTRVAEDHYTLLAVRSDGVVPVVDLVVGSRGSVFDRALAFLGEHASCDRVEVWKGGKLVREFGRQQLAANG